MMQEYKELRERIAFLEKELQKRNLEETKRRRKHRQLLVALHNINRLIMQDLESETLLKKICAYLTELVGYFNAWILLFGDDQKTIQYLVSSGFENFEKIEDCLRKDFFPCVKKSLKYNEIVIVDKPNEDCLRCPLFKETISYAGRSALVHVLKTKNHRYGVLSVSMPRSLAHDGEEQDFFLDIVSDIVFALKKVGMMESFQESESRFQKLYQHMAIGVAQVDLDFSIVDANDSYCNMLGYEREELIGKTLVEITHKETVEENIRKQTLLREGKIDHFHMEKRFIHKDGHDVYGVLDANLIRDSRGKPIYFLGSVVDITERVQSEVSLRESEKRWKDYIENAPYGVFLFDETGKYLQVNPEAIRVTGYEESELLEMHIPDLISKEFQNVAKDHFGKVVQNGKAYGELEFVHKNGEKRWWTVAGIRLSAKRFLGFVLDITDRKEAEREKERLELHLSQSQKIESLGRLAGGIAHDFNNMLGVILGHAEMALDQLPPSDSLYSDLQEIQKAAEHSADLTRQLLAFARRQTIMPQVLELNIIISNMLKMLYRFIGEDIQLIWKPDRALWNIRMDPAQINQLLANLCINARDSISGVGKITIFTKNVYLEEDFCANHIDAFPGAYVLLSIVDTGAGIDEEILGHIFEPFFTTKGKNRGTGLGLSTVYGIVKQNKGIVEVKSQLGEGSTFNLYLPKYEGDTTKKQNNISPIKRGHETILLVEDEYSILEMTKIMLERLGYDVLPAQTPMEAIRIAKDYPKKIHLLMSDVVLPEMNALELARHLNSLYPNLKKLYMSGYAIHTDSVSQVFFEKKMFIQKPFVSKELSKKIREVLDE